MPKSKRRRPQPASSPSAAHARAPGRAPRTPGPREDRIESLDVLRGLAVLGIYMVNVQAFAMTNYGYANPTVEADFGSAGQAAWLFVATWFQYKFITIFTALFGAGIVLMLGEQDDLSRSERHTRRMGWLLAIGVIHAYGFWYGDILVPYAAAGFVVAGARLWSVQRLVIAGVVLTLASSVMFFAAETLAGLAPPEEYAEAVARSWAPSAEVIAERQDLFASPWHERLGPLAALTLNFEVNQIIFYMPRFAGLMLVGMALAKSGFFVGRWPLRAMLATAALAPLGAAASWAGARMLLAADFELADIAAGRGVMLLASAPQALGYAAVVVLACRPRSLRLLRAPFAAAGRLALSIYLGCTLVSWFVFFGPPGLGRIGELSRAEQIGFVLWVWLAVLIIAPAWRKAFRFGPAEWVWRSLTYQRSQPMRRPPAG